MSMVFRPQIDGQTKRVNLVLQEYLRNYVNVDQTDWADYINRRSLIIIILNIRERCLARSWWFPEWNHYLL